MLAFADMMRKGIVMPAHFMEDDWHAEGNGVGAQAGGSHGHGHGATSLFVDYASVADAIGVYTTNDYANIVEHLVRGRQGWRGGGGGEGRGASMGARWGTLGRAGHVAGLVRDGCGSPGMLARSCNAALPITMYPHMQAALQSQSQSEKWAGHTGMACRLKQHTRCAP